MEELMARLESGMANLQAMHDYTDMPKTEEMDEAEMFHSPYPEDGPDPSLELTQDQLDQLSNPKIIQKMMQPHVMQKILTLLKDVDEDQEHEEEDAEDAEDDDDDEEEASEAHAAPVRKADTAK